MSATVVDDPWPAVWRKLVGNAAVNPVSALVGITNGAETNELESCDLEFMLDAHAAGS